MLQRLIAMWGLAVPAMLAPSAFAAAEPAPPAAQWIPQDAVVAIELSQPALLLDRVFEPKAAAAITSSPLWRQQASQPGFQQFQQSIKYFEASLGVDWRTGVRKLFGGGVTLAAAADQSVYLVVDCEDAELLKRLHDVLLVFARAQAEKQGKAGLVASKEYRGVTGWTFGSGEAHAIVGNRLVVVNRPEALKGVIDLRAEPERPNLASSPAYRAAKQALGDGAAATAILNLGLLKPRRPVQQALQQSSNPLAALIAGDLLESLGKSNWLSAALRVEGDALKLTAALDGKFAPAPGEISFARPNRPGEGALPNLAVPRVIAGLSLYRDLHAFYAAKDKLFPERTSELIFFENMMGIFFSGRDLTDEVLAQTKPEIRFVVAEQQFDPAIGSPVIHLPSFAAVFRLQNPKQFAQVAEEAWQKALGLVNVTRGQQGLPGLIIDRPTHGDTKFTTAYFSTADVKDKTRLDVRFNFRPALAILGDYLVLSSTEGLARDIIDALKKEIQGPIQALSETHSSALIDGSHLGSILRANRDNFVRQNMIQEAKTREQAETEIDLLLSAVKSLQRAVLTVGSRDGRPEADLEIQLNLP